jgi:hypothetical protein
VLWLDVEKTLNMLVLSFIVYFFRDMFINGLVKDVFHGFCFDSFCVKSDRICFLIILFKMFVAF